MFWSLSDAFLSPGRLLMAVSPKLRKIANTTEQFAAGTCSMFASIFPSTSAATRSIRPGREGDAKVSQSAWEDSAGLASNTAWVCMRLYVYSCVSCVLYISISLSQWGMHQQTQRLQNARVGWKNQFLRKPEAREHGRRHFMMSSNSGSKHTESLLLRKFCQDQTMCKGVKDTTKELTSLLFLLGNSVAK